MSDEDLIIVDNSLYDVIKKNGYTSSKYENTLTQKDLRKFLEEDKDKEKHEDFLKKLEENDTEKLSREQIFDFLDSINIDYSPQELDHYGLSSSFKGSLIYTFIKYDVYQKYGSSVISEHLYLTNVNEKSEEEIKFEIERGKCYLNKMSDENRIFFICNIMTKLTSLIELYIEESNSSKDLDLVLKYMTMIIHLLMRLKGELKQRAQYLNHESTVIVQRKFQKVEHIKEIRAIIKEDIFNSQIQTREVYELIDEFKSLREELKKKKSDRNILTKLLFVMSNWKYKLYYSSPQGGEIGVSVEKK